MTRCTFCDQISALERDQDAPAPTGACTCTPESLVEISHFTRESLRRRPQRATRTSQEISTLIGFLTSPMIASSKDAHGAWSPAVYTRDERSDVNVERVSVLAYDVDDCREGDIERSAAALAQYLGVVHTTFSATIAEPRHRIVLALSRPLTPTEQRVVWAHGAIRLASCGLKVDSACRDLARIYYAPVVRARSTPTDSAPFWRARIVRGRAVDVDRMLAAAQQQQIVRPRTNTADHQRGDPKRALARAADCVAFAPKTRRNDTLNRQTFGVARFHELSDEEIVTAMTKAARISGLGVREAQRTIASALRAQGRLA